MARTEEEIQADIDYWQEQLDGLYGLPDYYTLAGNVIDNRGRIASHRAKLRELRAELEEQSPLQGPDLIV